jgi:hypothetical protein
MKPAAGRPAIKNVLLLILVAVFLANPVGEADGATERQIFLTVDGLAFSELGPDGPFARVLTRLSSRGLIRGAELKNLGFRKTPDGYLFRAIKGLLQGAGRRSEVVDFKWSRDPADSAQTVTRLKARIKALCQKQAGAQAGTRRLIIIAHSWGTVLAYAVLKQLAAEEGGLKIDRLVTLGSPLGARLGVVQDFLERKQLLEKLNVKPVGKLPNVCQWINLWAAYDPFSGSIERSKIFASK